MKEKRYKIELSNEAEEDFDNAFNYYLYENERVANNFYHKTNESFITLSKDPFAYQKIYKNIHRFVMKKFPFVIYFRINGFSIRIIAIFHTSRNPQIWEDRANDK